MNSLTMCSGQGVLLQEKEREKECVVEDIRYNPHIPAPCHSCSSSMVCPALEEIVEEPRDAICDELDVLLREVRDLQEESSQSVVCSSPRLGSERWKRHPSDVSRARQKGAEGHSIQALCQEGFLKMSFTASGSRRARKTVSLST